MRMCASTVWGSQSLDLQHRPIGGGRASGTDPFHFDMDSDHCSDVDPDPQNLMNTDPDPGKKNHQIDFKT